MSQTTTPSGADVPQLAAPFNVIQGAAFAIKVCLKEEIPEVAAQLDEAARAVAALIARNAELEAERDALIGTVSERVKAVNAWAVVAQDWTEVSIKAVRERDSLAAENKALRAALGLLASPSCSMTTGNGVSYVGWQPSDGMSAQQRVETGRAALNL